MLVATALARQSAVLPEPGFPGFMAAPTLCAKLVGSSCGELMTRRSPCTTAGAATGSGRCLSSEFPLVERSSVGGCGGGVDGVQSSPIPSAALPAPELWALSGLNSSPASSTASAMRFNSPRGSGEDANDRDWRRNRDRSALDALACGVSSRVAAASAAAAHAPDEDHPSRAAAPLPLPPCRLSVLFRPDR